MIDVINRIHLVLIPLFYLISFIYVRYKTANPTQSALSIKIILLLAIFLAPLYLGILFDFVYVKKTIWLQYLRAVIYCSAYIVLFFTTVKIIVSVLQGEEGSLILAIMILSAFAGIIILILELVILFINKKM